VICRGKRTTLLVLLWLLAVTVAVARPKTDVVTLSNGDRLTGEIKKLNRGILEFKTDALDKVAIEWHTVAEVVSAFAFEFRALDGRLYYGSLERPAEPGYLAVATEQGVVELPFDQVSVFLPIEAGFWARLDGSLTLGFNTASSSNVTQFSGDFSSSYRTRRWESSVDMSVIVNRQDPEDTSRENVTYNSLRIFKKRCFAGTVASAEANEELGLDLRLLVGGAIGRDVIGSPHSRLRLASGLALNREEREGSHTEESIEGVAVISYDLFRFKTPEIDLSFQTVFYPNLSESERLRAESEFSLEFEVTKDFDWGVSAYDTYDSDPATAESEKHDWGVTTTISWDF
jgi:hypothetical protein